MQIDLIVTVQIEKSDLQKKKKKTTGFSAAVVPFQVQDYQITNVMLCSFHNFFKIILCDLYDLINYWFRAIRSIRINQ